MEWFKPDPIIPVEGNEIALIFAIGNYPGSQNDLIGPPYDVKNLTSFENNNYPEFAVKKLLDSEVTISYFENTIRQQFLIAKPGDTIMIYYSGHGTNGYDPEEPDRSREGLYLYDGVYWDDRFTSLLNEIPIGVKVIIVLDSCFAHGSTTPKTIRKSKFVQTEAAPSTRTKVILKSDTMNYIVIAACLENQTSADIGTLGGAFTHYWLKAWDRNFTYKQWVDKTAELIAATNDYEQIPNIEGDELLMNEIIFN